MFYFRYLDGGKARGGKVIDPNLPFTLSCAEMDEDVYNLFYQGKYQDVVSLILDVPKKSIQPAQVPPVVASLTFLGRIDEAKMVYERFQDNLSLLEATMSRFFLGVVSCRHFKFKEARRYFGENILQARERGFPEDAPQREKIRFYLFQGVGFYRYTYGSLRPALKWAKKSYESAFKADYLFGRLFSQDLLAHVEINSGKTHAGLKKIEQNIALAQSMKRDGIVQMSKATRAIYRSRFGISSREAVEELLTTLSETTFEDGYSRACLLAELSQQYLIRGNLTKAKETLNSACEYVYRIENIRLEILLNFRIAVLLAQQGEFSQALHLVRGSLKRLEENVDRHLELKLKGLEYKLSQKMGHLDGQESRLKELQALTFKTGYFTARRILDRARQIFSSSEVRLQDPLGDIHDDISRGQGEMVTEVIEKGWFGLLYPICEVDLTVKTLLLALSGRSLTVFDQGNVTHISRGASNQVAKFLMLLSQGRKTKEQIIQQVWQETYHPLRHDPLLYTLVSKLRKELGGQATWVEATEDGYELQSGVVVKEYRKPLEGGESSPRAESLPSFDEAPEVLKLNFRQQQILFLAKKSAFVNVQALGTAFQVSPATASRDLAALEEMGWLLRTGKGRATRYHFKGGKNNE